ncbi:Phosphoserine aminotransferase [Candidatus Bealeia paramacronuclearis]|uniref:phosphoserine transaminase n=1 Tax=Candidatus Bealeia paramacronuclearis TaxID=1921001 RepID=A0ABZ2C269_9PROT|nr:Phosphoserine aminotransferase [Candidatus Bealeia paramacronuclearis]
MFPKPKNPCFSSGPTAKRPGWSIQALEDVLVGRSHRAKVALKRIQEVIDLTREVLQIPQDYYVGIVPGSCTGAMEMALWNLLGPQPVDAYAWDVFGKLWVDDVKDQLKLKSTRTFIETQGRMPPFQDDEPFRDIVLTWNGTTTGAWIPDLNWLQNDRSGLVIADTTSALLAIEVEWKKLDAAAFSWQKGLGGEAAHGILVLSPKAIARLESYTPPWPMPRLLRLKKDGIFLKSIFEGQTLNTPSLLCIEDARDALLWCQSQGGLPALVERSQKNLKVVSNWVAQTPWVDFLVKNPKFRSSSSITLDLIDVPESLKWDVIHGIRDALDAENVAYDINGHILSSPCLRLWGGPMIDSQDMEKILPWIDRAYKKVINEIKK